MHYVYLLRSLSSPEQTYMGLTDNIQIRLERHNSGANRYTAKYRPWSLMTYTAFSDGHKTALFEKCLKQGSGHAFAKRPLW